MTDVQIDAVWKLAVADLTPDATAGGWDRFDADTIGYRLDMVETVLGTDAVTDLVAIVTDRDGTVTAYYVESELEEDWPDDE